MQNDARVLSNVTLQSTQMGDVSSLEWVRDSKSCGTGVPVTVRTIRHTIFLVDNKDKKTHVGNILRRFHFRYTTLV